MHKYPVFKKIIREILRILGFDTNKRLFLMRFFDESSRYQYEIRNHKYTFEEMMEIFRSKELYPKNILSIEDTISKIIDNKCSVSRLGDGEEFAANLLNDSPKFPKLKSALFEILSNGSNANCLVCINNFNVFDEAVPFYYRKAFAYYWTYFPVKEMLTQLCFNSTAFYGDAYAFLFYFSDNDTLEKVKEKSKYISKIWDNKKVLFILSKNSKILSDDFYFDNTKEKSYIYAPAENAYAEYEKIYKQIVQNYTNDWLIYLELGACASVLSYELSKLGYQALDMGDYYKRIILHKLAKQN